jgi:hypothetical protein
MIGIIYSDEVGSEKHSIEIIVYLKRQRSLGSPFEDL